MKSIIAPLSASLFAVLLTACGVEGDTSTVSAVSAPNLIASAPNFKCGNGVIVVKITNVGNADAPSSFFRISQTNAPGTARLVKALKPGESASAGLGVTYRNGQASVTILADSNNDVKESHENDNTLHINCK